MDMYMDRCAVTMQTALVKLSQDDWVHCAISTAQNHVMIYTGWNIGWNMQRSIPWVIDGTFDGAFDGALDRAIDRTFDETFHGTFMEHDGAFKIR